MAWYEGKQNISNEAIEINEKIKGLEGFLEEEEARYWFIQFLRNNISFAAYVLLGVELYPFQHITINAFERTDYSLYVAGRGLSKTWSTAVFAALHALFNQGTKVGVMAPSFRQSKIILEKLYEIVREPEAALFRQALGKGNDIISRNADQWTVNVGNSFIRAVPLGDGTKIRGQRFNCVLIDEFLAMPKTIHQEVIMPFISTVTNAPERDRVKNAETNLIKAGKMKEEDRYVWPNNKIIAFSSASYKFEYLYEVYQLYENLILGREVDESNEFLKSEKKSNATRSIIHFSHEVASKYSLYDPNAVEQARAGSSRAQFAREWEAQFTDDSVGFYSMRKIMGCVVKEGELPHIEIMGNKDSEYILSMDPSWSKNPGSDHFAMHLLKINEDGKNASVVHSYAVPGRDLENHIDYFAYIWENFNISLIVGDYAVGLQFIDAINNSSIFKEKGIEIGLIEGVDFNDPEKYNEDLQNFKDQYDKSTNTICYLKVSTSRWIRWANELLQGSFDNKKILFASGVEDEEYKNPAYDKIPITKLKFYPQGDNELHAKDTKKGLILSLLDHQLDMLELTRNECVMIDVKANPTGSQSFDLPQNLKRQTGPNKPRKDSYSALVLGNWGIKIYFDSKDVKKQDADAFFMPSIV
tara:strand:+ start:27656 stop:29578 length:1923 start_codon:yes stop_codon:yes gene_type:complete